MATFVLVPGAWGGGWIWKKVAPLLRGAGHETHTPTLTGLGERVHLAHPGIDLDTHITDVANVMEYESLRAVTLVGWSHGGMVMSGVADRMPERIAQLIFFDAIIPEDGQSFYDADREVESRHIVDRHNEGPTESPDFQPIPESYLRERIADKTDLEWVLEKSVPHPIGTLTQPIRLVDPRARTIPRAFVFCTEGKEPGFKSVATAARLRTDPSWRYREIRANHLAIVTDPVASAGALLSLV